jgi:hypothetical protein
VPGLSLPPALIMGFLVLYVLAISPLNYFVLRLHKPELPGSIPALVVIFTTLTYVTGFDSAARPRRCHSGDLGRAPARRQTDLLIRLYSPQRRSLTCVAGPAAAPLTPDRAARRRITILTADDIHRRA